MDKYGIYKKVSDPVLPEEITLVKEYDSKAQAEVACAKHKDTKDTHYYVALLKK